MNKTDVLTTFLSYFSFLFVIECPTCGPVSYDVCEDDEDGESVVLQAGKPARCAWTFRHWGRLESDGTWVPSGEFHYEFDFYKIGSDSIPFFRFLVEAQFVSRRAWQVQRRKRLLLRGRPGDFTVHLAGLRGDGELGFRFEKVIWFPWLPFLIASRGISCLSTSIWRKRSATSWTAPATLTSENWRRTRGSGCTSSRAISWSCLREFSIVSPSTLRWVRRTFNSPNLRFVHFSLISSITSMSNGSRFENSVRMERFTGDPHLKVFVRKLFWFRPAIGGLIKWAKCQHFDGSTCQYNKSNRNLSFEF